MLSSGAYCQPYIADFYAGTDLFSFIRICAKIYWASVHLCTLFLENPISMFCTIPLTIKQTNKRMWVKTYFQQQEEKYLHNFECSYKNGVAV